MSDTVVQATGADGLPLLIQPHFALVVVDPDKNRIDSVSENIDAFIGHQVGDCLAADPAKVLPPAALHGMRNAISARNPQLERRPITGLSEAADGLEAAVHISNGKCILELEAGGSTIGSALEMVAEMRLFASAAKSSADLQSLRTNALNMLRHLTGSSRVLIVEGGATRPKVLADTGKQDAPPLADTPWLTLAPVPVGTVRPVRIIVDASADPVPLLCSEDPPSLAVALDLAASALPHPAERAFLEATGSAGLVVLPIDLGAGSMISIVLLQKSPHPPGLPRREALSVFAEVFSMRYGTLSRGDGPTS